MDAAFQERAGLGKLRNAAPPVDTEQNRKRPINADGYKESPFACALFASV
jgi:hypothetical protein